MLFRLIWTALVLAAASAAAHAETFRFMALGDMPYGDPKLSHPRYKALIGEINKRQPRFTIHVGDIWSGSGPCSDGHMLTQLDFLNSFEAPLVYTPGDNEWTDCHRKAAGGYDVLERLAFLRTTFFREPKSLGKRPMPLERQSELMSEHKAFVENARFSAGGVLFATLHVVGSNNGFEPRDRKAVLEFFDRDAANLAWMAAAFKKAEADKAAAIVLAMQADMFEFDFGSVRQERFLRHSGFVNLGEDLVRRAKEWKKPVLLVFGDSHSFRVFQPWQNHAPNIIGLEVFGARDMHAVEVMVDTKDAAVFSFRPVWNPAP